MKSLIPLAFSLALTSCQADSSKVDWVDYGEDPMQNPQYMTDMTAAGAPGPQHQMLANHAGSWKVEGKMWMTPDAEEAPMTATATTQSLLGGRYIVEDYQSDFMGAPFVGRLMRGYDNVSGKFWSVWVDYMSTGHYVAHGTETSPGHVELIGTAADILTPGGRQTRMTFTDTGDGSYTMKMFDTREGTGEFQVMELHYTRN
jgi:hypothetical protein